MSQVRDIEHNSKDIDYLDSVLESYITEKGVVRKRLDVLNPFDYPHIPNRSFSTICESRLSSIVLKSCIS